MFSFSSILSDTKNFINNNLVIIIISLVTLSIISQTIALFYYPNIESITAIKTFMDQVQQQYGTLTTETLTKAITALSEQEKTQLVSIAMSYLIELSIIFFISNLIHASITISLVFNLSYNQFTFATLFQHIIRVIPQIILFILICIPCFMGLLVIATLIAPLAMILIIAGSILYMFVYILFLAVIVEPNTELNFISKIRLTFKLLKMQISLITPMMVIWIVATFLLNSIAGLLMNSFVINVILNTGHLLLNFIVVCYFYRLYLLTRKVYPL